MNGIEYEFNVLEPEFPDAFVPTPQTLTFDLDLDTRIVYVYFMSNLTYRILDGVVSSGMGTVNLWYTGEYPDGIAAAGMRLRKVEYRFTQRQGMASNVVFHGERRTK